MLASAPILHAPPGPPAPSEPRDPLQSLLKSQGALRVLDITMFHTHSSGGVRTYLDAKRKHLAREGISHALIVPDGRDSVTVDGDSRTYRIRSPLIPTTPGYRLLVSPQAVEQIIQEERPDVVEMGSPFLVPLLVRRATRGNVRPPVVGFYHSDIVRTYAQPGFGRLGARAGAIGVRVAHRYIRDVYGPCAATVAASRTVVRELEALGLDNVHLVPLGVDLDTFHPVRRGGALRNRLGVEAGTPLGIFCGRLCPEKRLDVVLEARMRIPVGRRPHLVLVGDGQSRDGISARATGEAGLTVLPFQQDRRTLAALMADADFYLASGPGETFGLAVAEGMASGLPILGVDSGAVPDRVEGSGAAELYPDGDVDGCREAMERLISSTGPALRAAARAHAERHFDWSDSFHSLLSLYRSVLGG